LSEIVDYCLFRYASQERIFPLPKNIREETNIPSLWRVRKKDGCEDFWHVGFAGNNATVQQMVEAIGTTQGSLSLDLRP
jgi:hypothetical protein